MGYEWGSLDWESYSEAGYVWDAARERWTGPPGAAPGKKGLPVVGLFAYASHPSTEVLCLGYRLPGETEKHLWTPGLPLPERLFAALAAGGVFKAHNAMFEYAIWQLVAVRLYGFPSLEPHRYQLRCTMATARVNSLPGALANLSDVLNLPTPKDADGKRLLEKFSMPRNPTKKDSRRRVLPSDDPEDFARLCAYCLTDLDAEQGAADRMTPMAPDELLFWWIDQEINWAGIHIDRKGVRDCIAVLEQALDLYGQEFKALTGLDVTQLQAARGWLAAQGVIMTSMDDEAITEALAKPNLPAPARRALELRALTASASVKKLYAMENQATPDDRLCNLIVHHGARTGRPTGEGPQPLNLPKAGPALVWCASPSCHRPYTPTHDHCPWCAAPTPGKEWRSEWSDRPRALPSHAPEAVDCALEVMATRDVRTVEWFFGDALLTISGCVRGLFVAPPGHDLIASDYTAIEAVVIAALAGETWRLETIAAGKDIYYAAGETITGVSYAEYMAYKEAHEAHHPDRNKKLKVAELACLTPQTQVLTQRGYVPMLDLSAGDKLWDGVEWVTHKGLVNAGTKTVLRLDGVEMTPDHKVTSNGSWLEARQLASDPSILRTSLANGSASLPCLEKPEVPKAASFKYNALAGLRLTQFLQQICVKGGQRAVMRVPNWRPAKYVETKKDTSGTVRSTLKDGVCSIVSLRQNNDVIIPRTEDMTTTAVEGFTSILCFAPTSRFFLRTSCVCPVQTIPLWSLTASTLTKATNRETCVSLLDARTWATSVLCVTCKPEFLSWRSVYDIADAGPRNRFTIRTNTGHLIVHNCGFGGWIGALRAFGFDGTDEEARKIILGWRAGSPRIVELWGGQYREPPWKAGRTWAPFGLEGCAVQAIQNPGVTYECAGIRFHVETTPAGTPAMIITLLSGRRLTYHQPSLQVSSRNADEWQILYWTWNSNPKYGAMGWVPMQTYAGRLAENVVQATAHDILRHAIIKLRAAGYPTRLHVYDEIVVSVPKGAGSVKEVERIMADLPDWAAGWPIRAAGGWRGYRYRKA